MLDGRADIHAQTKWRDTPLHYAASGSLPSHMDIIQLLLVQGACMRCLVFTLFLFYTHAHTL